MNAAPRPVRVAMVMREFYPLSGGYQNQALRLARELARRPVEVQVVTAHRNGLTAQELYDGIHIHRIRAGGRGHLAACIYLVAAFCWMARHRRRFDVIHAMRLSSGLVAGLIGAVLRKPVVCKLTGGEEVHGKRLGHGLLGRLKLACLRRTVDRYVALTAEIERALRDLGLPERRIVRIANGIELGNEGPSPAPPRLLASPALGLPWNGDGHPVAIYVGRLIASKGLDWLLDAWTEVARREPLARLLVVGDGPERPMLEARCTRLGLRDVVHFTGARSDVGRLLAVSDVFVLPSRHEGMSNALLEAMAAGLPVVVSDDGRGGNRAIVEDGRQGYVVPVEDRATLAAALAALLGDPVARRVMGARARRTVEARFAIAAVADRYCALYRDLLAGR